MPHTVAVLVKDWSGVVAGCHWLLLEQVAPKALRATHLLEISDPVLESNTGFWSGFGADRFCYDEDSGDARVFDLSQSFAPSSVSVGESLNLVEGDNGAGLYSYLNTVAGSIDVGPVFGVSGGVLTFPYTGTWPQLYSVGQGIALFRQGTYELMAAALAGGGVNSSQDSGGDTPYYAPSYDTGTHVRFYYRFVHAQNGTATLQTYLVDKATLAVTRPTVTLPSLPAHTQFISGRLNICAGGLMYAACNVYHSETNETFFYLYTIPLDLSEGATFRGAMPNHDLNAIRFSMAGAGAPDWFLPGTSMYTAERFVLWADGSVDAFDAVVDPQAIPVLYERPVILTSWVSGEPAPPPLVPDFWMQHNLTYEIP